MKFQTRVFALSLGAAALSASIQAQAAAFDISTQDIDHIVVVGLDAQVQLQGQANAAKLRVTGIDETSEPGQWGFEKHDRVLFVRMQEYPDKKEWKDALAKPRRKVLEFVGQPVSMDIQLREGLVTAQHWSKDLKVDLVKGKATAVNGSGALNLQVQSGDVAIQDQSAKTTVDIYKGLLSVKNLQADLDGSLFSGSMNIEKSHGFLSLNTNQGQAKIVQSSGTLQFENGKGVVIAQNFSGRIDGQTLEGNVNLGVLADSDVHVKSTSGRVTVQTPANSGASVNVLTNDGEIVVPKELNVTRGATEKTAKGRLHGAEPKGSVFVRSQEGTIVIK